MCPLQSNQWLAIQMWDSMTNFAIILKVKSGSSGMTSYHRFDLFQCCFVSNGNSFRNRVICLRKFNQTQPWEQHWHSTSPDCGVWETLWLFTELIHGYNMADRAAFHQEIQSDSLTLTNKQVEAFKSADERQEDLQTRQIFHQQSNVLHFCTKWNFLTRLIC